MVPGAAWWLWGVTPAQQSAATFIEYSHFSPVLHYLSLQNRVPHLHIIIAHVKRQKRLQSNYFALFLIFFLLLAGTDCLRYVYLHWKCSFPAPISKWYLAMPKSILE